MVSKTKTTRKNGKGAAIGAGVVGTAVGAAVGAAAMALSDKKTRAKVLKRAKGLQLQSAEIMQELKDKTIELTKKSSSKAASSTKKTPAKEIKKSSAKK